MYTGKIDGRLKDPDFVKEDELDRKTIFDKLLAEF
jgi:hypothetical protein